MRSRSEMGRCVRREVPESLFQSVRGARWGRVARWAGEARPAEACAGRRSSQLRARLRDRSCADCGLGDWRATLPATAKGHAGSAPRCPTGCRRVARRSVQDDPRARRREWKQPTPSLSRRRRAWPRRLPHRLIAVRAAPAAPAAPQGAASSGYRRRALSPGRRRTIAESAAGDFASTRHPSCVRALLAKGYTEGQIRRCCSRSDQRCR